MMMMFMLQEFMNNLIWEQLLLQAQNLVLTFTIQCKRLIDSLVSSRDYLDVPIYASLVCQHLDYACVVWCLFQLGDIRAVEKSQRRATKIVPALRNESYHDCSNEFAQFIVPQMKNGHDYNSEGLGGYT